MEHINDEISNYNVRQPSIAGVSIVYSIVVLLFLTVCLRFQHANFYSGMLITEFIVVLLPPLIYLVFKDMSIKEILGFKKVNIKNSLLIFLIILSSLPIVGVINLINLFLVEKVFGRASQSTLPIFNAKFTITLFLINIFIVAIMPAICEETLFRGFMQRTLSKISIKFSILFSAFLFALIHMDMQKLFGTFFLGTIIGYIAYRTGSVYGSMLAHFINNFIALVCGYLFQYLAKVISSLNKFPHTSTSTPQLDSSNPAFWISIIILIILFFIFVFIFLSFIFAFTKNTAVSFESLPKQKTGRLGLLWIIPGVLGVIFIYLVQSFNLLGLKSEIINKILSLLA